jgi:SAM-dependent methyltransferase
VARPGEVVGIDREPSQVEAARAWAAQRGVGNVRFEVGSVYALPYPAAAFDAVLAFTVLEHLRDPLRALREMRRVLRPGGVAGVSDPDYGALLQEPSTPGLAELNRLMRRFSEEHGSPYYARHQRRYLLEAGFARSEAFVSAVGGGDPRSTPQTFRLVLQPTLEAMRPWIIERGLGDGAHVDALLAEARARSERPDAFFALLLCAAVAWAP